jgi:hypothetical protein
MKLSKYLVELVFGATMAGSAQAWMVVANGGALVNDTTNHLTWTSDMNLLSTQAAGYSGGASALFSKIVSDASGLTFTFLGNPYTLSTNDFDADGTTSWFGARAWVNYLNVTAYQGYNDWTLPTTLDSLSSQGYPDGGPGNPSTSSSQLAELFYGQLGQVMNTAITTMNNGAAGYNLFSNVQFSSYWSGTEFTFIAPGAVAWTFGDGGFQASHIENVTASFNAEPVRIGDVIAVPEPTSLTQMLMGLGLVALAWRRRPR